MKTEMAILGGGVAGLSAANQLADRGSAALVIEAGHFPAHKVCGEFLSPECIPILRSWGIEPPVSIQRAHYIGGTKELRFDLPVAAAGFSRYELDHQLAERAKRKGIEVMTGARVKALFTPEETGDPHYTVVLDSGEKVEAKSVMIGIGRILGQKLKSKPPVMRYTGLKMHFGNLDLDETLMMFSFPGTYLGLSHVGSGRVNLACVSERGESFKVEDLFELPGGDRLEDLLLNAKPLFENWMTVRIPEFGMRSNPSWPRALFIGDAAGSIPPATGNGLGMAMTGGIMAADMALADKANDYPSAWRSRYSSRLQWGRFLHRGMTKPARTRWMMRAGLMIPGAPKLVFDKTRENP